MILLLIAQLAVAQGPDLASYVTSGTTPAVAAYQDIKAHDWCKLGQLAIGEAIFNVSDIGLKKLFPSQRPCAGCGNDGGFSGHSGNAILGASQVGWKVGITMSAGTGLLRFFANRHTPFQVIEGISLGVGAEYSGKLIRCH